MPKFCVTINEVVDYDVVVEAADEDAAEEAALEEFLQAEDISGYPVTVHGREVSNVEGLDDPEVPDIPMSDDVRAKVQALGHDRLSCDAPPSSNPRE